MEIHPEIKLTEAQLKAFEYMANGKNVFITGPSGTGKSALIKLFKKTYGSSKNIVITSTTGISALLIGGTTLHSYLGIGLGTGTLESLSEKIMKIPLYRERWKTIEVLIIDEISMLSPELFDKLEGIARIVRRPRIKRMLVVEEPELPFGGIQLILSGDWLQLPVVKNERFCFESDSWSKCIHHSIALTQICRQTDIEFQECLNDLRFGNVTDNSRKLLESCSDRNLTNDLGIKPTVIHTTNGAVDIINESELDLLAAKNPDLQFNEYNMKIQFHKFVQNRQDIMEKYKKNCIAPPVLQLCVGAQVMLVANLDLSLNLANGSRGVVTDFSGDFPIVQFVDGNKHIISYHEWNVEEDEKKILTITQIPLKLAWAITVHKAQGCTLDYAEVDLSNVFTWGMAYVALSRVRRKEGLNIVNINFETIQAHPKAVEFYRNIDKV